MISVNSKVSQGEIQHCHSDTRYDGDNWARMPMCQRRISIDLLRIAFSEPLGGERASDNPSISNPQVPWNRRLGLVLLKRYRMHASQGDMPRMIANAR
jgi:hypothetical protein